MIDDVLLRAIRRYWTEDECDTAYNSILVAYSSRRDEVVVITSKGADGDQAAAQVVVGKEDYREWMDTLEARLDEYAAEDAGTGTTHQGVEHVEFRHRYTST